MSHEQNRQMGYTPDQYTENAPRTAAAEAQILESQRLQNAASPMGNVAHAARATAGRPGPDLALAAPDARSGRPLNAGLAQAAYPAAGGGMLHFHAGESSAPPRASSAHPQVADPDDLDAAEDYHAFQAVAAHPFAVSWRKPAIGVPAPLLEAADGHQSAHPGQQPAPSHARQASMPPQNHQRHAPGSYARPPSIPPRPSTSLAAQGHRRAEPHMQDMRQAPASLQPPQQLMSAAQMHAGAFVAPAPNPQHAQLPPPSVGERGGHGHDVSTGPARSSRGSHFVVPPPPLQPGGTISHQANMQSWPPSIPANHPHHGQTMAPADGLHPAYAQSQSTAAWVGDHDAPRQRTPQQLQHPSYQQDPASDLRLQSAQSPPPSTRVPTAGMAIGPSHSAPVAAQHPPSSEVPSPQRLALSRTPIPAFPTFGDSAAWRDKLWRTAIAQGGGIHDPDTRNRIVGLLGQMHDLMASHELVSIERELVQIVPVHAIPVPVRISMLGQQVERRPTVQQPMPVHHGPSVHTEWLHEQSPISAGVDSTGPSAQAHVTGGAGGDAVVGDDLHRDWHASPVPGVSDGPPAAMGVNPDLWLPPPPPSSSPLVPSTGLIGAVAALDLAGAEYSMLDSAMPPSPPVLKIAAPASAADSGVAANASAADSRIAADAHRVAAAAAPGHAGAAAPLRPPSPPGPRARVPPVTKEGRARSRGQPVTLQDRYPDEDGERPPIVPLTATTPRSRYQARRKRSPSLAAKVEKVHEEIVAKLAKDADDLGIPREEFFREMLTGSGLVPSENWNLFQQFRAMPPEDWDVRAAWDFSQDATPKAAWERFKKEADYKQILRRFAYAFPEGTGLHTVPEVTRFFWATRDQLVDIKDNLSVCHGIQLSFVMAGQNSATDSGLAVTELASNAKQFLNDAFNIRDVNTFTRVYQGHVQNVANLNEIADIIGAPLPREHIDLDGEPRMTDPALYAGWDIGRIMDDVNRSLLERANPQLVPPKIRSEECQYMAYLVVYERNGLCLGNWPWWLPLPSMQGLYVDKGIFCHAKREQGYLRQWLSMRHPDDVTRPHPLGPRLFFAGERTMLEVALAVIKTKPVAFPGSKWHGLMMSYFLSAHRVKGATTFEVRHMREASGEVEDIYHFKKIGPEPSHEAADDAPRTSSTNRVVSSAFINDSDEDEPADEQGPDPPPARTTRSTTAAASAAIPVPAAADTAPARAAEDATPAAKPPAAKASRGRRAQTVRPPLTLDEDDDEEFYEGTDPKDGPRNALWLPPSRDAVPGFPGGVPDGADVWTCAEAASRDPSAWSHYKSNLTKARKATVKRISKGAPPPGFNRIPPKDASTTRPPAPDPIVPTAPASAKPAAAANAKPPAKPAAAAKKPRADADTRAQPVSPTANPPVASSSSRKRKRAATNDDEFQEVFNPKAARTAAATTPRRSNAARQQSLHTGMTPSKTAAPAHTGLTPARPSAVAHTGLTPSRRASSRTPSRAPSQARSPSKPRMIVDLAQGHSRSARSTPAPLPAPEERRFNEEMTTRPFGKAPAWLHCVPDDIEKAAAQTSFNRATMALKLDEPIEEIHCKVIEEVADGWSIASGPFPPEFKMVLKAVRAQLNSTV